MKSIIPSKVLYDANNQAVNQIVRYYRAAEDGPSLYERLKTKATSPYYEQQIKDIVKTICEALESSKDELYLYGFGRGAFIIRAVAGVMHTLRLPKRQSLKNFDTLYQSTLDCFKARYEDDNRNGPKIIEFLSTHTTLGPRIRFVGAFDTVKYTAEGNMHDLNMVSSINNMRHALALNETRSQFAPDFIENPSPEDMKDSTFIQAWFMGANQDLGGGSYEDGLSLYPLQWMILESIKAGLIVRYDDMQKAEGSTMENPLALAFPHFAGEVPKLDTEETIEWRIGYANGIQVALYDLQSVHGLANAEKDQTHSIHVSNSPGLYNTQRKIFGSKAISLGKSVQVDGLIGWNEQGKQDAIAMVSRTTC